MGEATIKREYGKLRPNRSHPAPAKLSQKRQCMARIRKLVAQG